MDVIDISVAKKYTDDTVAGAGAVAGKPCQIQSITDITGGHRVTFLWVDNSSVSHTSTMDVMDGEKGDDGLGIKSVAVNSSNHLIVTYDDDTTEDAGEITLDTSDFVQKSSTAGLLKNDGTVDTTDYTVVSYTQTYSQSGQKIGEITIDGTTTDVVAPTGGGSEHGIPSGGTSGQILSKKSSTDYDVQWTDAGTASQEQADWNEADSSKVDYIKNKPDNLVQDANYVHTDYNYDATAKGIVDGIPLTVSQLQGSLLEKFPRSEQAVLGAKNWFNPTPSANAENATITNKGQNITIANASEGTWNSTSFDCTVIKNTDYTFKTSVDWTSGVGIVSIRQLPNITIIEKANITSDQNVELTFNSGDNEVIRVVLFCTTDTSALGDIAYNNTILKLATDTDDTYVPYAMTNRELTEAVSNIPTVSVSHSGTASSTTARKQQITVNNVAYDVDGSAYMEQEVILSTSSDTVVTFTNNELIVDGKMFTVATSIWDLVPTSIVTSTGSCVITFPKQTNAATIGVRLYVR